MDDTIKSEDAAKYQMYAEAMYPNAKFEVIRSGQ
jgi:hypothetical protein